MKLATLRNVARRALAAQRAGDALAPKRLRAYVLDRLAAVSEAFGRTLTRDVFTSIPVDELPRELVVACSNRRVRRAARQRERLVRQRIRDAAARALASGPASVRAHRGWETRRERDDAVTVNMPAELLSLWRRVGASIGGGTPHERYENFMRYAEEHPSEAVQSMQDAADAKLAAMLRERGAA